MRVMLGDCEHEVKVTRLADGWGVRVFTNGVLNQETTVYSRADIGAAARGMLRMEDKCGNISKFASAARYRITTDDLKTNYKVNTNFDGE